MTVAAPSDQADGSMPEELQDAFEKHISEVSHFDLQEKAEPEALQLQSVRQSDRLQSRSSRGGASASRSRTPRTPLSVEVRNHASGEDTEGGERRPSNRIAGAHKSPELPAGLISPRAGFTSTAVLALPAPFRAHAPVAKRARGGSFARAGKGGLARQLSVSASEAFTEGEGSGRSGTNSGNNVLRECSVCHLHKSPRWRTGPEGPKTLCNRCGVYWSQNRHKWDELVDRFKASSDGEVNQLQAEFKAVRYGKNADLEQKRAKGGANKPPLQGAPSLPKVRKASTLGGHSRSDTETILRKLQELPGHFAKSLRKELLGFGLVRKPSPKPEEGEGQGRQQVEAEEEVVISSGSDDEGGDERVRNSTSAGPSGTAHGMLLQGSGSSNNLDVSVSVPEAGVLPAGLPAGSGLPGIAHPGENKAKRKRSETKIVRDTMTQAGTKKARLVPGESAEVAQPEALLPIVQRKEEDVIKEAEELLRKGGLTGTTQRAGHFVSGRKSGVKRTVKVTERRALQGPARPANPVGIVINSAGLAKIRIGGLLQVSSKEEAAPKFDEQGLPLPQKKKPGRPPNAARLASQLAASENSPLDPATKKQLAVTIPQADGSLPEGMTPIVRSARIKARGPAPDFTDDFEDDEDLEEAPVKKRRGRPPSAAKLASLAFLSEGGQKYKGAKRGRKPRRDGEGPRKRGRPAGGFSSKLDEFERVFKPSVRRTKRPRMGIKEPRSSVDFGSPSGDFPLIPDSLLVPPFPAVPELLLPSRLQKNRSRSPAPGSPLGSSKPRVPMQVGDITVESFGSVDPQHITVENGRICAIGYRSTWKDPTLGLVHVSEVVAGEDGRPVYSVTCRLKERTDEEGKSLSPQASLGRSNSLQLQQSPRLLIQRSSSLGREQDGRFRAPAPSPLGQSQQNAFAEGRALQQKASRLEPREQDKAEEAGLSDVLEGAQRAAQPVVQAWGEGQLATGSLSPEEAPLEGSKALVPLKKEPTISPLLVGRPGPPIEGLKGLDEGADLHDLDTAMIWDEDFHVPFGDVEMPQVSPEVAAFSSSFGPKSEGQELGWGFGPGNEQDRAWGVNGQVSEQEAEEGMLAVFRGPGEGAKTEGPAEEVAGLQETPTNGLQAAGLGGEGSPIQAAKEAVSPPKATSPVVVQPPFPQEVSAPAVAPPSSPPIGLLRIKTSPSAEAGPTNAVPELAQSPKSTGLDNPPTLEPKLTEGLPQPRRPGRPKRLDTRPLPAVVLPDRQLRSERQSQGVETPRTAHRRLTGSDLLVKKSSPEEAWKAYAASWRETFKARAPEHVEEINWAEFERDHFGLEKPEVVQWIANLFQASPRLTQARESFQNLQLLQHSGSAPLEPTAKSDAERLATRAEQKEAADEAARLKRQLADGMRRQLVLFNAHPEGQAKEEAKVQPLEMEGVSVAEFQEVLQVYDQLSAISSLDVPSLDVLLSGLIHPTPSADSLINAEGITLGKPKSKPKSQSSKPLTAVKPLRPVDASEAVAALHLQLVRVAAAKTCQETQRAPKLMLPHQEVSPGPARETTPIAEGEVNETAAPPPTPRLEEISPTGGLSDSGEKVPARASARAPKWKAGLTNGEAPWALLMSRKMNGSGHEMEKDAGAHHEGPPFRQGLELLDSFTWPAFARRVLEQEPGSTKPAVEEEQPQPEETPAEPATEIKVEAEPLDGAQMDEEESVPLPIILTPVAIVRRVEKEAQVLAEAERQLAKALALLKGHEGPTMETADPAQQPILKSEPPVDLAPKENEVPSPEEPAEHYAFWWSPLEGLGPVNTNQGSKIRGRIQAALAMRPPEWARLELGRAIGRDVYRSSAGGPMKRVALSVLDRAHQIQAESAKPSLAKFATTKACREVIRLVAEQDDVKIFSNLSDDSEERFSLEGFRTLTGGKGFRVSAGERRGLKRTHEDAVSEEMPCGYVRRVDLRTIDMRLAARAYGSSLELFLADVQSVWENARQHFPPESREFRTANELSELFKRLYEEKVFNIGPDGLPLPKPSSRPPKDLTIRISDPVWGRLPKAPWEWEGCKVCGIDENDAQVLLCDHCSEEYHTYCLDPPLARIPEGDWLCHNCRNLPTTPLASPTVGRPGRKKGSGRGRRDGRKTKPRPRDAFEPSVGKRRGRPLSAKGAERRAAEERKRFSKDLATGGPTRMERLDGVLALEAPESPASRLARLAEEAQEALAEEGGQVAPVEEVKFLRSTEAEPQKEMGSADESKPLTRRAATEGAKKEGEVETAEGRNEQLPAVAKTEGPGEDIRTLRSKAAVPSAQEKPRKRKGQNQYTKRKELADLAAKSAVEKEEGDSPPQETKEQPRKRQNQYTKRKELALAAGKSKTGSPSKTAKSSPEIKVGSAVKLKSGKGSPASKLASALKAAAKEKQAKKGQNQYTKKKEVGEVKRKGENQYTKAKRLAEEAAKEARRAARRAWRQAKKKRLAEEAALAAEGKAGSEQKRKGENQYTKAKKLAEGAAEEKKPWRGENQYTKAKKLAEQGIVVKKPSVTVSHKKKKPVEEGTEVKRRHENQYTKAKRLAEEKAKEEAGEVKRRGENQYTKAKRLAEESAKEAAAKEKRKGENQYTKAKKLALEAGSEGKPVAENARDVKPQVDLAKKDEEKPRRKRENQYTKRKRLLEQGLEVKPASVEPRSGLRSKAQGEAKQETLDEEVVYYMRRKVGAEEVKTEPDSLETQQSVAAAEGQEAAAQLAVPSAVIGSAAGQAGSAETPCMPSGGGVNVQKQEAEPDLLAQKSEGLLASQPISGTPIEMESCSPHAMDVDQTAAASNVAATAVADISAEEPADVRPAGTLDSHPGADKAVPAEVSKQVHMAVAEVSEGRPAEALAVPAEVSKQAPEAVAEVSEERAAKAPPVHAEVSKQASEAVAEVSEGRRAKRPRLNKEEGATRRASQQGERKERRSFLSRGSIVKAAEVLEEVKEKSPEQLLAARMGECTYWDLSLSERIHVLTALARKAANVTPADATEKPVHLGSDSEGVQYWAVTSSSLGPLLLTGKPSLTSAQAPTTSPMSNMQPSEGPAGLPKAPFVSLPERPLDSGAAGQETKASEAVRSEEPAVIASLTPVEPMATKSDAQPDVVSDLQKAGEEGVSKAVAPASTAAEKLAEGEARIIEEASPMEVEEQTVQAELPSKGEQAKVEKDSESEPSLLKGTWQVAASAEELAKVAEKLTGRDKSEGKLVESLRAWEERLRQGLDTFSGQGRGEKRPIEEVVFTQRKKQKVAEEEYALRATEHLAERERTAGDSCAGKAVARCVCGEPLVLTRVHCPFCHCSAEKGKAHAFSHWCDRPHGCLLLERVEGSPAFELTAGADALEESQADLEVLAGLEMDLQAVFAEGLDYPGLGGVASAPFTSLARSPPQRVALNRQNRGGNLPTSELPPAAVPLQDAGFEPAAKVNEQSLLHSQSLPLAKPLNPLGATASLPADTGAIIPYEPPASASPELKPAASSSWLVEGQQAPLTRLKMDLLDLEAALSPHCLGGVRSTPERCNAWRVMVKSASTPEELASAAVLLELMIKPALVLKEWASMGPLSRAVAEGNGKTIAHVALMIHSLDGVIDYEGLHAVKESSKKRRVR